MIPLFPLSGMYDVRLDTEGFARALDVVHHLALPAFTLGIIYLAQYSRISRASMLDVLGADYVRTARAKGLSEGVVLCKHALRNAVLPVVTLAGLQFGSMLSGAVLVETVFNWPGLGQLAFESILRRDHPTILGILFFASGWWWWPTCSPISPTASSTPASAPGDPDPGACHARARRHPRAPPPPPSTAPRARRGRCSSATSPRSRDWC